MRKAISISKDMALYIFARTGPRCATIIMVSHVRPKLVVMTALIPTGMSEARTKYVLSALTNGLSGLYRVIALISRSKGAW